MKQKLKLSLLLAAALAVMTACTKDDDIDEIFTGKSWYMNGATINGLKMNSDIKNFYAGGSNAYYIHFSATTFQGALTAEDVFAGTWKADGKNHSVNLSFTKKPEANSPFDKQIYGILSGAESYDSGAEFLRLKESNDNVLVFGDKR